MNDWESNIVKSITGNSSLETANTEMLKNLAAQYPYFGVVQYLYAKKLQQQKSETLDEQLKKTALHFSNTAWLDYLFIKEDLRATEEKFAENEISVNISKPQPVQVSADENKQALVEKQKEFAADEVINEANNTVDEIKENVQAVTEENIDTIKAVIETGNIELLETVEENTKHTSENILDNDEIFNEKIADMLQKQVEEFHKPVQEEKTAIATEPYYTIDYFASQGIKLEDIKQAHDKFETKVKRFTDWLKQMKRISPQPTDLGTDEETEKIIENIAATSNETKEIVTEAMAEVLVKQGKIDKAVQLYIKLSFLKPDKSTYFAAKIEALKGI